jgi:hypothetical protein
LEYKKTINIFKKKNKVMEKETKFLSLYDYLGYAAGGELGKAVYAKAKETNQPTQQRDVSNTKFKGKVLLYTLEFLDSYFKPEIIQYYTGDTLQDDELPF